MGGLGGGIFWGCVVAIVGLAAVSLSTPLPPREDDTPVEVATDAGDAAPDAADAGDGQPNAADVADDADGTDTGDGPADMADAPAGSDAPEPEAEPVENRATPSTEVPLPSGSEFNRPPPEPEAAIPAADARPSAFVPAAPLIATESTAPRFDTAPAAQPDVGVDAPASLSTETGASAAPDRPATSARPNVGDGPVALSEPDTTETPTITTARLPQIVPEPEPDVVPESAVEADPEVREEPETAPEPEVAATGPEAEAAPAATDETAPAVPETQETPAGAETPDETVADTRETAEAAEPETPAAPAFPTISAAPSSETVMPSVDTATFSTPLFPQSSTLPQVVIAPTPTPDPDPVLPDEAAPDAAAADDADPDTSGRAIIAFASPFDAAEDRPLMAIVLIDEPDSRIDQSTLLRFSIPVAFAIDPLHPDAEARAAAYREAGFEVVILGSMVPEGATPSDLEVALTSARGTLPEAVALLDSPDGRIQGDRPILDATVAALAETGHGLLAFPRGLNAAEQSASRSGVPGATLFRLLDDQDQRATMITRFLARAEFTATQEGTVIVAGHTRPDTITALFSWALGDRSEAVAIAPLSATLLRASGE